MMHFHIKKQTFVYYIHKQYTWPAIHFLIWKRKPNINQLLLYFMVKHMFEAAHSNTIFNPIVEEARNENNARVKKQIRGRQLTARI